MALLELGNRSMSLLNKAGLLDVQEWGPQHSSLTTGTAPINASDSDSEDSESSEADLALDDSLLRTLEEFRLTENSEKFASIVEVMEEGEVSKKRRRIE